VKRTVLIVIALGAVLAGYLYWASDERQIRRLLDGVADAVSQEEGAGGVVGLAEVAGLTRYLAPDVTFEPGAPFRAISGAQEIVSTVGRLRAVMTAVDLTFSDPQIAVDGRTASVRTTATIEPSETYRPTFTTTTKTTSTSRNGNTFNERQHRFGLWNNNHIRHMVIESKYLERNPYQSVAS